ncbi:hypothetical protein M0802_000739 [Mischocyttarus mexicanus]|nr:hypothetical protein M0802_000739 [Mischocyttarus mexicanus]
MVIVIGLDRTQAVSESGSGGCPPEVVMAGAVSNGQEEQAIVVSEVRSKSTYGNVDDDEDGGDDWNGSGDGGGSDDGVGVSGDGGNRAVVVM